jgi:deazaflavin-dependent oxidoreductase (nitroreductase family)
VNQFSPRACAVGLSEGLVPPSHQFLDRVRQFNKRTFNPWILRSAGMAHSPFAVVGHVGRRSRMMYATPVIAMPLQDGFAFALTYGPEVDWYRNILAIGSCSLRWRDKTYKLDRPETMSVEAGLQAFPFPFGPILRLMRKRDFFRMRLSHPADGAGPTGGMECQP